MRIAAAALLFALAACVQGDPTRVDLYSCMNANPDTCRIEAKFPDLASCQFYEQFVQATCDSKSKPGRITCDLSKKSPTLKTTCSPR